MHEFESFYCDIKNRFFSCLMNPNCRAQNNFLIDCNTQEEYEHAELQLRNSGLVLMEYNRLSQIIQKYSMGQARCRRCIIAQRVR